MANQTQFLPWATGVGANVLSPANYAAIAALQQGFQNGVADSAEANTALRQGTFVSAAVAKFTADFGPNNVLDDGNLQEFENNFVAALSNLFEGVQFLQDVGTANAIAVNPGDPATVYSTNMVYIVRIAAANIAAINNGASTITVSGLAPVPVVTTALGQLLPGTLFANGLAVMAFDGQQRFQLLTPPINPNVIIHFGQDVSITTNEVIFATDPSVIAYNRPTFFAVPIAITNTSGVVTGNGNGIGWIPITRGAGGQLMTGDLVAGTVAFMCCDGSELQLINPQNVSGGGGGGSPTNWNNIAGQISPYWIGAKSATTTAPPSSPSIGDIYLIPTGATGAWSSQVGSLAEWTGTAWVFATYPTGAVTSAGDTLLIYFKLSSGWVVRQLPSFGKLYYLANL